MATKQGKEIPQKYWDKRQGRWNSHLYFDTINHWHVSDYSSDKTCDIMIVECQDGRFYIEDNWGEDALGVQDVFNPFDKKSYPTFFDKFHDANHRASEIVCSITGSNIEEIMIEE